MTAARLPDEIRARVFVIADVDSPGPIASAPRPSSTLKGPAP